MDGDGVTSGSLVAPPALGGAHLKPRRSRKLPRCRPHGTWPSRPRGFTRVANAVTRAPPEPDAGRAPETGHQPCMIRLSTTAPSFEPAFTALLNQARETTETVDHAVAAIIADVRARGDAALIDYTTRFDRLTLTADHLRISPNEIDAAVATITAAAAEAP